MLNKPQKNTKKNIKTGAIIESYLKQDLVIKEIRFVTACGVCCRALRAVRAPSIHVKQIGSTGTTANCQ